MYNLTSLTLLFLLLLLALLAKMAERLNTLRRKAISWKLLTEALSDEEECSVRTHTAKIGKFWSKKYQIKYVPGA